MNLLELTKQPRRWYGDKEPHAAADNDDAIEWSADRRVIHVSKSWAQDREDKIKNDQKNRI